MMRLPFGAVLSYSNRIKFVRYASTPRIIVPKNFDNTQHKNGFFIGAPDMPSDTAANNPLLALPDLESRPPFANLDPYTCFRAFTKKCLELQTFMDEVEQDLIDKPESISINELINKLESHSVPLHYATSVICHLEDSSPDFHFKLVRELFNSYTKAMKMRFESRPLYLYLESLEMKPQTREDRLLKQYVYKLKTVAKMEGTNLPDDEKFRLNMLRYDIKLNTFRFMSNLGDINRTIGSSTIFDGGLSKGVSAESLKEFTRLLRVNDASASKYFLESCPNATSRQNFWKLMNSRGLRVKTPGRDPNSILVEKLRKGRREFANLLGYEDYVQYAMESKMAGHIDNVRSMLNTLHVRSRAAFERDMEELTKFSKDLNPRDAPDKLDIFDIDYYMAKYKEHHYSVDLDRASQYFPLEKVLTGLFSLLSKLFAVEFSQVSPDKFSSWSSQVKLYDVSTPDGHRGSIYFDPAAGTGTKQSLYTSVSVRHILSKSEIASTHPISAVSLYLPPNPLKSQDVYLTFDQVLNVFSAFGATLEHILTEVPLREINGTNYREGDTELMVPYLLSLFPLLKYDVLKECTSHAKTGEVIPLELYEKLIDCHFKFGTMNLSRDLYDAALDLALGTYKEYWLDVVPLVWSKYMQPFEGQIPSHVCSASNILVREPAGKYCRLWSQVLACDLYKCIEKDSDLTFKIRDTFLSSRGEFSATDLWKALTGRNPSAEPLTQLTRLCISN